MGPYVPPILGKLVQIHHRSRLIKGDQNDNHTVFEQVQNQIFILEDKTRHLRSTYGDGQLDEEELFQWAKLKALEGATEYEEVLGYLDELRRLRKQKRIITNRWTIARIKRHRFQSCQPIRNSARWWSVVIGISDYTDDACKLLGASADAKTMYKFLAEDLVIPDSNIALLVDAQATRKTIITTLYGHLLENPAMQQGDKRLVYFAGHGASYEASDFFTTRAARAGSIEAICPVDRGHSDDDGRIVYDISDRELNSFLREVNNKWGPETVVIFDCCHSGSCTRGANSSNLMGSRSQHILPRSVPPLVDAIKGMLEAAEENRKWNNSLASAPNWKSDITTHVLLAACESYEQAMEIKGRGLFTRALLVALRDMRAGECTWRDLIGKVGDLCFQTPKVVGQADSMLWFG